MLAFWLTLLVEAPWWLLGLGWFGRAPESPRRWWLPLIGLATTGVVNLVTHPVVWRLTAERSLATWVMAELAATAVDAILVGLLLRRLRGRPAWPVAIALSLGANASSALVGVVFF